MSSLTNRTTTDRTGLVSDARPLVRIIDRIRHGVADIPAPLRGEYVMALNRLAAGTIMLAVSCLAGRRLNLGHWAVPILGWMGCGVIALLHLRLAPHATGVRRSCTILLDVAGATTMLIAGGDATAFIYVVYLWVIIGYGFRFGKHYIFAASLASIVGFSLCIAFTPFWRTHLSLSFGLLSGIVVLPAYSFALIRQIAEARRLAERADQAKSLFLASVSHELRTPLNAIIGTAELLETTPLNADQAEMVATISTAADGQLSLVRDVLEFSRIEAGHGRSENVAFDLAELFAAVRAIVTVEARRKGLLFNCYISARSPLRLFGDERHLREVLLNLCGNAIKFTQVGSVTIAADGYDLGDGTIQLRLEVADTGIGIAPDARQNIFEIFTQANATILDRFGGTGLGLALCERQIRLMGGTIGVDSVPGAGSIFWVNVPIARAARTPLTSPDLDMVAIPPDAAWALPLASRLALGTSHGRGIADLTRAPRPYVAFVQEGSSVPPRAGAGAAIEVVQAPISGLPGRWVRERFVTSVDAGSSAEDLGRAARIAATLSLKRSMETASLPEPAHAVPPRAGAAASSLAGLRVLVADDNAINRTIVSRMLAGAGIRAILVQNGEEALEAMSGGDVDVALLDVNMPEMDGIEAAQFYHFSAPAQRMPLIALTADASPETRARCLQVGMVECLVKPVRTAELLEALARVLPDRVAMPTPSALPAAAPAARPAAPRHAILDLNILADLRALGGTGFVEKLIGEFEADSHVVLEQIESACLARDVRLFRTRAHSMCSIAANVGAQSLRNLCLPWKDLSETVLERDAASMLASLRHEWATTQAALKEAVRF